MKTFLKPLSGFLLFAACCMSALAADISGNWKSEFDTQIGHLKYTYELKADGEKLTGKAFRDLATTEIVAKREKEKSGSADAK